MDEYIQYVKNLQARGYSTEEIMSRLSRRGLDLESMQTLLQQVEVVPRPSASPDAVLEAYVDYVKARVARGASPAEIDQDLEKRGVDKRTAEAVIQMALRPAPTYAPAPTPKPEAPAPEPIQPVESPEEKTEVSATISQPKPVDSGNELNRASEHLLEVANHLSAVADKIEAIEEGKQVPDDAQSRSVESTPLSAADEATHLNQVADHLDRISNSLETAESKPRPAPIAPAATMQLLNRAHQAALSNLPMRPVFFRKPAAVPPAASATAAVADMKLSRKQTAAIAGGLVFYAAVFIQSLARGEKTITWLALISMNIVGTVGFNIMLRRSEWHKLDQWLTATVLQTGLFLPFLVKEVVAPIRFPTYTGFDYLLLGLAVCFLISLQFCNVKALQHLEASVYSVVYNSRIIFATLFGWVFLSEAVGLWGLLGGALIFVAIFIVKQKGTHATTTQGIIFGLGAALAISLMNTCEKELIKVVGYEQYIFPLFTIATLIMWTVVLLRRTKAPFEILLKPRTALLMGLRAAAGISFSYSLVFGPVAVSSYLSSLSVILMVICGLLFLGERDYIRSKIYATIVAIFGLTFILVDSFR